MQKRLEMKVLTPLPEGHFSVIRFFSTFAGTNPKIQNSNLPRECIRQFFPKRKCFIFDRPTSDRNLLFHLEKVPEDKLDSTFQEQSKKFCTYIFNHTKTKTLKEGIIVTGSRESPLSQSMSLCQCVWWSFDYTLNLSVILFTSVCNYGEADVHGKKRYPCVFID